MAQLSLSHLLASLGLAYPRAGSHALLTGGTDAHHGMDRAPRRPDSGDGRFHMAGLDGLRALACLAVLAYHLLPDAVPGGFLGVDVFFVLSGFLITGLLLEEHAREGRLRLGRFWLRRIRRLVPAVITVLLVTLPLAWAASTDLLVGIKRQVAGALGFVYNWVTIADGTSYFAQATPRLYLNVWSLGVEEQFYVLWPLALLALLALRRRLTRTQVAAIPLGIAGLSAAWMALLAHLGQTGEAPDFTRAYMGTDSHAFGLMAGAALALGLPRPLARARRELTPRTRLGRGALALAGLALVIVACLVVPDREAWAYPWGTLLAVLGAAGLLQGCVDEVAGAPGSARILPRALDVAPLRWIGQRSYGIYLWHWPILTIIDTWTPHAPRPVVSVAVSAVAVGAAALSYRYLETPLRTRGLRACVTAWWRMRGQWRRLAFALPVAFLALTVPAGTLAVLHAPAKTALQAQLESVESQPGAAPESAPSTLASTIPPGPADVTGANILVIGDSVTLGAKPALQQALPGVIVDGAVSRTMTSAPSLVRGYQTTQGPRPWVVVSLATNSAITDAQVDAVMTSVAEGARVVFVTGFGPARCTWIPPSNERLRAAEQRYPDRVRVADWAGAIGAHTDWLGPDGTHPTTPEAEALYVDTVRAALTRFDTR